MTHILAIYTVLFVAILFTTVGIWAGDIATATGDFRILLFTLGAFSLKLAIDDYVGFSKRRKGLLWSLSLSLIMYLLLAGSIAYAALARPRMASVLFALVFLVGIIWIVVEKKRNSSNLTQQDQKRLRGWLIINSVAIALLFWASILGAQQVYSAAKIPLALLFCIVVFDFVVFGTLQRLAALAEKGS